jgi:hypothetical protein
MQARGGLLPPPQARVGGQGLPGAGLVEPGAQYLPRAAVQGPVQVALPCPARAPK